MLFSAELIFRPYAPGDAPALVDAIQESTATLTQWMPWATAQFSADEALTWIAVCEKGWADRSRFEFGIFDRASGVFVGGCGLNQINEMHGFCNLGYWVRQSRQGQGVAPAAIRALADFAWTDTPLQRLEIVVGVGNVASLRAAHKAGAVEEGIARRRIRLGQGWVDAHMLSLVAPATT
jgi:ribosomal-protein-serine acetyltransferase